MRTVLIVIVVALGIGIGSLAYHLRQRSALGSAHERSTFEFVAHGPYAQVFPLFGAEKERVWAGKEWDPTFVYPKPANDIEGAVFTVKHGHTTTVPWVNTAFDVKSGHVQYVYVIPDTLTTLIDIHLVPQDAQNTKIDVMYERTALTAGGDERVHRMAEHDRRSGPEWSQQINNYLQSISPSKP
jgi:hypothetical protein